MSLDFKLHYDRLREGDPTKPETAATKEEGTFYEGPSHARNLCLVWPDGRRHFLSYAYLVYGVFTPGEEINEIKLDFSSYIVTLKGYGLEELFSTLISHSSKEIVQISDRYAQTSKVSTVVHFIAVDKA